MPVPADVEIKIPLSVALERWSGDQPDRAALALVLLRLAAAAAQLSRLIATNPLRENSAGATAGANLSGDEQKPLDVEAEALFVAALQGCDVAAVYSEESPDPIVVRPGGSLAVTLDPVDGSSNIETLAPIGTIFSVLPVDERGVDAAGLRPGRDQLAAGLVVYGPTTMLVLTMGSGTDLYALDPATGSFLRTRESVQLPTEAREYAINASNARHWGPGIREYIDDLVSGARGPREREFNMRWLASLVGEAYRIFVRGGVFLYPADARPGYENGRIRLVYEANPVALLCEQAGGAATDGTRRILDVVPTGLHQRIPFVFGSRTKVERVARYLQAPLEVQARSPLFRERGLLRGRGGA